ncbi:SDR family NAD(P)-dependent oxidoreductase [Muricoccus vinaceus]|uniref:SDR family NAD(P)-dependent oxidoreductase n=1 Tax=Muricoccus vinaceus TaxID=424704 RepID=A0ABV6IXX0_9PROT
MPSPPALPAAVSYRSLRGRRVVITGGATGIGAAMAGAFAAQGCNVHVLDIQHEAGGLLADTLPHTAYHACDLRDVAVLRRTVRDIEGIAGGIDVLVNNAASDERHAFDEVEPEQWRDRLAVNLDHQFFATQAVAQGMRARARGSIILFSSTSWIKGRPGMVGYTTAKAAVIGLTKTLARELGSDGVRVNCIVPGAIVTERQLGLWRTPEMEAEFMASQALKLRLQASHVASVALFLASDEAAGCTGAQFVVDAGLT